MEIAKIDGAAATVLETEDDDSGPGIPLSELLCVLVGVGVATKTTTDVDELEAWWTSSSPGLDRSTSESSADKPIPTSVFPLNKWCQIIGQVQNEKLRGLARLTLGVTYLRQCGRQGVEVTEDQFSIVWSLICGALTSELAGQCTISRSAQGFLAIPLCSLLKHEQIDELFRLHVWLPDSRRGNPDFAIHAHQPFAQSWILAGEGRNRSYRVDTDYDQADTTHALYKLTWAEEGEKDSGKGYKTHQSSSTAVNTGKLVRVALAASTIHTRNSTYSIPSSSFHTTEVLPLGFHATLFFFDASRGFDRDAAIVGPKDGESYTVPRAPNIEASAENLANWVQAVRDWEFRMEQGRRYTHSGSSEHALREYNTALGLCETMEMLGLSDVCVSGYRRVVLAHIGGVYRRFGRYEEAKDFVERALRVDAHPSLARANLVGELVVIYRHMNLLDEAKSSAETQYSMANALGNDDEACRALGNLGMVNYQMFLLNGDRTLLAQAIDQVEERVRIAHRIYTSLQTEASNLESSRIKSARIWEVVGLSRLSLCHAANGDLTKAVEAGLKSLNLSLTGDDPVSTAMTRFFYGRALFSSGQRDAAMRQFNPPGTSCTPAMAFCREPSDEHLGYLQELVQAGVDVSRTDDDGYSALDYAVFSGNVEATRVVLDGIRQSSPGLPETDLEKQLESLHDEAKLRKAYRELFQEKLRFALHHGGEDGLTVLRRTYRQARTEDEVKRTLLDGFKYVPYSSFTALGRLPHSRDNLARELLSEVGGTGGAAVFVIFFSYRWFGKIPGLPQPDDGEHTQYKRMVCAAEDFLRLHPNVNRERLGIWLDLACVDQDNKAPGIAALPISLLQCNAVISLIDDHYYSRAWCSIEILIIQILKRAYDLHTWYEHTPIPWPGVPRGAGSLNHSLIEGPVDITIDMSVKELTYEEDRSKLLFLERQIKLLA